jgi:hypothetical protein
MGPNSLMDVDSIAIFRKVLLVFGHSLMLQRRTPRLTFVHKQLNDELYEIPIVIYLSDPLPTNSWELLTSSVEEHLQTMAQRLAAATTSSSRSKSSVNRRLMKHNGFVWTYHLEDTCKIVGISNLYNRVDAKNVQRSQLAKETLVIHAELESATDALEKLPPSSDSAILEEFFNPQINKLGK